MIKEFPVKLITKNSTLNNLFTGLLLVAFIGLFIFYLSMVPSERSSNELQALWFIEGVPLWVKQVAFYGFLALMLALIIDFLNKKSRKGELRIGDEEIVINTWKKSITLKHEKLKEIVIVGKGVNYRGDESANLKIIFKTNKDEIIRLKLLFYLMADELMESLNVLVPKDIKIWTAELDPYRPD